MPIELVQPPATTTQAATQSARGELTPHSAQVNQMAKGSGSGADVLPEKGSVEGSGSGYDLPEVSSVRWELNAKGGWEAWHSPDGAYHRQEKTYLGYLGKRQLAMWKRETPERYHLMICEWIVEKRKGKGIE